MTCKEAISILRSNCARLVQIVDNQEMDRIQDATQKAIDAMNYDIMKAPLNFKMTSHVTGRDTKITVCPDCGYFLMAHYNYCPHCGQALDWSDQR